MMQRFLFGLILSSIVIFQAHAQTPQEEVEALSPGWQVASIVAGPLLKPENPNDVAAILSQNEKNATLRIYARDEKGTLTLQKEYPKAICTLCGGMKGGPVPFKLSLEKSVLNLIYAGGSREEFTKILKWRFQNDHFYLIGLQDKFVDTMAPAAQPGDVVYGFKDANINTLKMNQNVQVSQANHKNKIKKVSCKLDQKFQKFTLEQLDSDNFLTSPNCPNIENF